MFKQIEVVIKIVILDKFILNISKVTHELFFTMFMIFIKIEISYSAYRSIS